MKKVAVIMGSDSDWPQVKAACEELRALGVPEDLYEVLPNKIEVAPWVLEDIASSVRYRCFLSEQYPTADGLEVERTPLN